MLIKGRARGGSGELAAHLQKPENERAEVKEMRGVIAPDLDAALSDMELAGSGSATRRPLYHASINPDPGERVSEAQWLRAVDRLERELGLTGQPRVVVEHEKAGRTHRHVVWLRIDLERMTAIPDGWNYAKHESVARELEREFGHERVQGAHAERHGRPRPARTPSNVERHQVERGATPAKDAKALITGVWQQADSGQSFRAAVERLGWQLTRGDGRDFVLLDPAGETHSLTRRIDGAKAKDVRARMADLDPATLPSVEEGRAQQRSRGIGNGKTRTTGGAARKPGKGTASPRPLPRARYLKRAAFRRAGRSLVRGSPSRPAVAGVRRQAAQRATHFRYRSRRNSGTTRPSNRAVMQGLLLLAVAAAWQRRRKKAAPSLALMAPVLRRQREKPAYSGHKAAALPQRPAAFYARTRGEDWRAKVIRTAWEMRDWHTLKAFGQIDRIPEP